ncbi:hypothetical protein N5A93_07710 [Roseovarius sp. EGI FJ00037]|uniref:hypothetical protein n=1 Tax=Roseovarius salincola TaxID=2978479 RepID=UPI0022A82909|nr:hypothetical protein [Roseovarius sp. EGI FJ00037]MCZ0812114.1 hypothetical protein [Roseovarius sp. EGI FJ00037]
MKREGRGNGNRTKSHGNLLDDEKRRLQKIGGMVSVELVALLLPFQSMLHRQVCAKILKIVARNRNDCQRSSCVDPDFISLNIGLRERGIRGLNGEESVRSFVYD